VLIRTKINADQFIDCIEGNRKYLPGIIVVNKVDLASPEQIADAKKRFPNALFICAKKQDYTDELKERIYKGLKLIRIYLKEVGKKADLKIPLIMNKDCKIRDVCSKLHRDFITKFKYARVWGNSAKFDGQMLRLEHKLLDGDVVELHLR